MKVTPSTYKVVLVGASGVGKTAIVQQLVEGTFEADGQPTIGVEFKSYECQSGSDRLTLNIWDTAGQEKFRAVSKIYFRSAVGAILVFSLTDRTSFDALDDWLNDIHSLCAPNVDILLVGNKLDLREERVISQNEALSFSERHGIEFIETSAVQAVNISETFLRLARAIHDRVLKECIEERVIAEPVSLVFSESTDLTGNRSFCC
jgi:small GTP-binding protein